MNLHSITLNLPTYYFLPVKPEPRRDFIWPKLICNQPCWYCKVPVYHAGHSGLIPGWTNTQGLKIIEEKMLPLLLPVLLMPRGT